MNKKITTIWQDGKNVGCNLHRSDVGDVYRLSNQKMFKMSYLLWKIIKLKVKAFQFAHSLSEKYNYFTQEYCITSHNTFDKGK